MALDSTNNRVFIGLAGIAVSTFVNTASLVAQGQAPGLMLVARDFIRTMYRNIDREAYWLRLFVPPRAFQDESELRSFAIAVDESQDPLLREGDPKTLLYAHVSFSANDHIDRYWAEGRLVHTELNSRLIEDVQQHPEWTLAVIEQELQRRGAAFGPRMERQLLEAVDLKLLKSFLGELSLKSASFRFPASHREANRGVLPLWWVVVFSSSTGLEISMEFEPFDGRLVSMRTAMPR